MDIREERRGESMPTRNIARILLVSLAAFVSSSTLAQEAAPAPTTAPAGNAVCDAVCALGRALNERDSPIQSRSGIGRGVVTKEPQEQRKEFRPPGYNDSNKRTEP
jgi:hypothetical protein